MGGFDGIVYNFLTAIHSEGGRNKIVCFKNTLNRAFKSAKLLGVLTYKLK
jgi:hypothetical protein